MRFASTLRQSQFSLLQYLFQDLNQALCFCLRHIITSPFKFTIQRYFCPYFQHPHPGILRKFTREGAAVSSRNSPRIRSPLGGTAERSGAVRRLCRSRAGAAKRRWCASAGRTRAGFCRDGGERALCRAAQRALSALEAGAFLPGGGPPTGRGRGLAAWGPQRPRVGRGGAGRARCRAAGAGGIRRLSGADAGKA